MKNKLTYEEALEQLKRLERRQRLNKGMLRLAIRSRDDFDINFRKKIIIENCNLINLLLAIIHAHKPARKLYNENRLLAKND